MAARFWVGGTGTWDASDTTHWAATSGGAGGQSVPGSGDTVTFDASSGGGTITVGAAYSPNVTSITMGAFTGTFTVGANNLTLQTFNCSGTGTRTVNMGSGTWTITGNAGTIFTISTITNLTWNYETATVNCTYSGSVGTRTFILGSGASATTGWLYNLNVSAGTDAFNLTASGSINIANDINFTGYTGTMSTGTSQYYGNVILGTGMTWASTSSILTLKATSSKNFTSNGVAIDQSIVLDGVGGSWVLQDAFALNSTTLRSLTLTNGTFDANGKNVTCGAFYSSNANTRTLTMGSGQWTITGNAATVWDITTFTNLTFNKGSLPVIFNYSGSTGTRTIVSGAITPLQLSSSPDISITAGTDIVAITNSRVGHLNFTGFAGTLTSGTRVIYGDITISTGMTWTSGTAITTLACTSVTQTITTNGKSLNSPFVIDGVGGTVLLADHFSMDGASARALTLTNGTLNANNKNVTCGSFSSNNANVRTVTMGSGTWTLTGTGTVWNFGTTTNLTYNVNTSTVIISDTSASSKTINPPPPNSFYNIIIPPGGAGAIIFTASGNRPITNQLSVTGPKTLTFNTSGTFFVGNLNLDGRGGLITITSNTAGVPFTFSVSAGLVSAYNVSLKDSTATGGAYFEAVNSTNVSGNTGWNFVTAAAPTSLSAGKKFARFGGARAINKVLDSKFHGYRKLGG